MEEMVSKTFMKVLGLFGCLCLTVFSGIFAMVSLGCLFLSVVERDILTVILSAFAGFVAWVLWSIRKDTLA